MGSVTPPLAIDLFCGLGGWTAGLLAEGWDVVGFDVERHAYGDHRYPARLVLQDIRTIHGSQFEEASLIVASPPCQEYSYMAMPWSRAKAIAAEYRSGARDRAKLTELFDACFRIQREAIEAAGHFIPLVVENVRGAQPWVGRSRWAYGSFHLWGDVPALMPITMRMPPKRIVDDMKNGQRRTIDGLYEDGRVLPDHVKVGDRNKGRGEDRHLWTTGWNVQAVRDLKADDSIKNAGGSWFNVAHNTTSGKGNNPTRGPRGGQLRHDPRYPHLDPNTSEGVKGFTPYGQPLGRNELGRKHGSKSSARKAASARIAKIPEPLARWIAKAWKPRD